MAIGFMHSITFHVDGENVVLDSWSRKTFSYQDDDFTNGDVTVTKNDRAAQAELGDSYTAVFLYESDGEPDHEDDTRFMILTRARDAADDIYGDDDLTSYSKVA